MIKVMIKFLLRTASTLELQKASSEQRSNFGSTFKLNGIIRLISVFAREDADNVLIPEGVSR